jgi:hypothetical protein
MSSRAAAKRTVSISPGRIPIEAGESAVGTLSRDRYARKEHRLSRGFLASSTLEVKPTDCVAEQSGFELPTDSRTSRRQLSVMVSEQLDICSILPTPGRTPFHFR